MYTIVGLGNPGEEYEKTRHNAGRLAVCALEERGVKGKYLHPDTFMNKTGSFVAKYVKSKKAAGKLIVIYDDLDLPLGTMKISYNRGSGGHKGLESVIRALKTKEFIRVRIGIGKKEPVERYILSNFSSKELTELKKVFKKVGDAVETLTKEGLERAMTEFNR